MSYSVQNKCSKLGVLNLLVLAYPPIKIVPLCVPPNQTCIPFAYPPPPKKKKKLYPNKLHLYGFF